LGLHWIFARSVVIPSAQFASCEFQTLDVPHSVETPHARLGGSIGSSPHRAERQV
jgi:hypothetical protein